MYAGTRSHEKNRDGILEKTKVIILKNSQVQRLNLLKFIYLL